MSILLLYFKYINCINELEKYYKQNNIKVDEKYLNNFTSLLKCQIKLDQIKKTTENKL